MPMDVTSSIMRTTIDIDTPILKDLKRLQKKEGRSLGRIVSDLLAKALHQEGSAGRTERAAFEWISRPMGARVDLADREAVLDTMDRDDEAGGTAKKPRGR
jgi:hypothetical protein